MSEQTQTTDFTDINDISLNDIDLGLIDAEFEEPNSTTRDVVPAGFYYLQMPETIPVRVAQPPGFDKAFLEVKLDGLKVAAQTPDGTDQPYAGRFVQTGGFGNTISTLHHYNAQTNDVMDLLVNFGAVNKDEPLTIDTLKAGLAFIAGKVTPNPIAVEPRGSYQDEGQDREVKRKGFSKPNKKGYITVFGAQFKDGDDTLAEVGVVDSKGDTVMVKGRPTVQGGMTRGWRGKMAKGKGAVAIQADNTPEVTF